jgi:hypothetical protein
MSPGASPLADASLLQLIWLALPRCPLAAFHTQKGSKPASIGLVATESEASDWLRISCT